MLVIGAANSNGCMACRWHKSGHKSYWSNGPSQERETARSRVQRGIGVRRNFRLHGAQVHRF